MNQETWSAVDAYINDLWVEKDAALAEAIKSAEAAGLPAIAVSPNQGKLLFLAAKMIGAKSILELGTLAGYSAIWLGRALPQDGRMITLEYDPKHAKIARQNIARAGLEKKIEVIEGKALQTLPTLGARGPFDLIFLDADKENTPEYFAFSLKLSRPGGLIIVDNVVRDGKVIDGKSADAGVRGIRRFNEMVAAEKRVTATAIQTVGAKGYDGFAVLLVKN
jgi:predicted O-methyltransferase YrrM